MPGDDGAGAEPGGGGTKRAAARAGGKPGCLGGGGGKAHGPGGMEKFRTENGGGNAAGDVVDAAAR